MRESFRFLSADGKTQINAVRWLPENEPRYIVQLTHGMLEFIDRYSDFAEFLASKDTLVVGHDHLGHGDSVTSKDEWGYMGDNNQSGILVEDMHALRVITQKDHPNLPYFMFGHSMGSYLLRKYLVFHGKGLAGAIIAGTGDIASPVAAFGNSLCSLIGKTRGWHYRSRLLDKITMGGGAYKLFDSTGKEPERSWITRDTEIVKRYYADPRCTFKFTASGYKALIEAVAFDGKPENIAKIPHDLPILLISGEQDPVGDLGKGVKRVDTKMREEGLKDVTLKLWPDCRHEVLNELNRSEVYDYIYEWLESHFKPTEASHEAQG